jgi:NTP pyrophosphatase (non-canonical NTP hydrolase)
MRLRDIAAEAFTTAKSKGFISEGDPQIDRKLMMAIGELVEAQNELRSGHLPTEVYYANPYPYSHASKPEGFGIELADALIRIAQLAEELGIDLENAVGLKMAYNATRPYKHGGKAF